MAKAQMAAEMIRDAIRKCPAGVTVQEITWALQLVEHEVTNIALQTADAGNAMRKYSMNAHGEVQVREK